jgi:hypothetical protein
MQLPATHSLQQLGMAPRRARRLDPLVSDPFCEMEHPLAVDENRGAALLEIQPARIHLTEMREQIGLDRVAALDELQQAGKKLSVGKSSERFRHELTSRDQWGEVNRENNLGSAASRIAVYAMFSRSIRDLDPKAESRGQSWNPSV